MKNLGRVQGLPCDFSLQKCFQTNCVHIVTVLYLACLSCSQCSAGISRHYVDACTLAEEVSCCELKPRVALSVIQLECPLWFASLNSPHSCGHQQQQVFTALLCSLLFLAHSRVLANVQLAEKMSWRSVMQQSVMQPPQHSVATH